ncbi:MAG: branched-chain amino acid aminotransferase [Oscillospiraceae bacterium]|nr:branched-chain amino acid aminotransferase [Oscillospiraceae bacterium]
MDMEITIQRTATPKEKPQIEGIPFGTYFSDHMFLMNYETGKGWYDPRIVPYGPLSLDPSTMVLHYAQEIFEGLKAYRTADGKIQLFRPTENIARMNRSAEKMCIPPVPEDIYLKALKTLVEVDKDWVPSEPDTSLYIRPFIIATDKHVGVHASHTYLFMIITCPVGSYYPEGLNPVKIAIESREVRAVRGGTGFAKCGGNYAASLHASELAESKGFSQVLWLDGVEQKYIEEVGAMNVMFKIDGKIVTPSLAKGTVLPGITRKSAIQVLSDWGYEIQERDLSVDELIAACESGKLEEAWGVGTAAVVSPIGEIIYQDKEHVINGFQIGELTQKLYDTITGIQWGKTADPYGWVVPVC